MVDVVGLRFVSEGGEKAVQDLNKYKNAQNDLASATQKNITFSQRNAAQLQSVAQAYASGAITLREAGNLTEDLAQRTTALARAAGATDAQLVSLVRRFHEMADAALSAARAQEAAADYERRISAQMAFNEQLGVAGQRATEMGASFSQLATVLDNLYASARQFTSDLNDRLGVTGQRAVETGASFSQFATVLDNLDASARRFTSDLNDRLGVTGQRAVETGASFSQFATILDNLDAAARRFTSDLNARLGVTGQRAVETGASFSQFATILDNLDAAARQFTTDLNQRLGVTGQRATQAGASFSQFAAVLDNIEASARRFTSELNDRLGVTGQRAIQSGAGYEALEADIESAAAALKNFQASFDPTAAAARRLEDAQTVLANAVRTGAITQEESNRIMQQYRGALDDTAKANELLRRETQAMAMAYNPVMAAQITYERKQQELNRAHELGVISADKLQAELTQLAAAYNAVGGSTLNAQRFTNQFGENVRIAGIKTNRFGMVAQQVGYQVGDFFVQIQSGTNAFVAFGQQATQLAGLLPGVAGAIVGISISVGTMLLAAYDRTRRASEDFADATFDINEAAKSATEELKSYREELAKLASEYKTIGEIGLDKQIKALDDELKNLEGRRAAITGAAATGFGAAGGIMSGADLEELVGDALRANTNEIDEQIRLKRGQLRLLVLERESVEAVKLQLGEQNRLLKDGAAAALGRNSSFRQSRLELERELKLIQMSTQYGEDSVEVARQRAYYEAVMRGYTEEQRNAYIELVLKIREAEQALEDSKDATEAVTMAMAAQVTHQQQIATLQMTINERRKAYRKTVDDANRSIEDQIALNMAILQFGEDSQQVEAVRAAQAREAYRQQQLAAGIVGNHLKDLMRQYDLAVLIAKAVEDSADNAEDLRSTVASTDLSGLAAQAALLASNMGVAADEAVRYNAALNRQAGIPDNTGQPRLGFGGIGSMEDGPGLGTGFARIGFGNLDQPRLRTRTPMATPAGGGGGGGGGAAAAQDDYLKNLLLEAEQKRKLVGLTEDETRRQEILFELKKRELPLNDERIEQIIQTEAETRKLIEAEQQREQLMQTIEGNIKSAFMSMVDGSQSVEDAFRNMLRNILLAVYEQKVATPAATAIGGLLEGLFNANGNVFSGGSRVTAYANGGVVNSPTYFPMSSGVGLMGEAGPEAIMPLKRGANGKLGVQVDGNAGNVTVVQNFNIAANGDESVRRIVRQETPRIAEQAKAAVVDAKRRGGAYGRSF